MTCIKYDAHMRDTMIDFVSQTLRELCGSSDLAHFVQVGILLFAKKYVQGCQSGIRMTLVQDMLVHQNPQKPSQPQVHGGRLR